MELELFGDIMYIDFYIKFLMFIVCNGLRGVIVVFIKIIIIKFGLMYWLIDGYIYFL